MSHSHKFILTIAALGSLMLSNAMAQDEEPIPERRGADRYSQTFSFSPFNVTTNVVVKEGPNFASDLTIAGITVIKGQTTVTVINSKTREYTDIETNPKNEGDIRLVEVNYSNDRKQTSAVLASGEQKATVRYDPALFGPRTMAGPQVTPQNTNRKPEQGRSSNPTTITRPQTSAPQTRPPKINPGSPPPGTNSSQQRKPDTGNRSQQRRRIILPSQGRTPSPTQNR